MYLLRQSHTVPQENALHAQRHIQYEIRKYLWVTNGLPDVQSGWQMSVWQVYCNPGIGGKDPIASKNKTKIFSKNNSNLWYFGKIWLNFVSQLKEMFFFISHISLLEFASTNRHSWIEVNCDVSVIPDRDWAMVYLRRWNDLCQHCSWEQAFSWIGYLKQESINIEEWRR